MNRFDSITIKNKEYPILYKKKGSLFTELCPFCAKKHKLKDIGEGLVTTACIVKLNMRTGKYDKSNLTKKLKSGTIVFVENGVFVKNF